MWRGDSALRAARVSGSEVSEARAVREVREVSELSEVSEVSMVRDVTSRQFCASERGVVALLSTVRCHPCVRMFVCLCVRAWCARACCCHSELGENKLCVPVRRCIRCRSPTGLRSIGAGSL
jgi:hypothetical protein